MQSQTKTEILVLKIILGSYILFALVFAGLNWGYAPQADPKTKHLVELMWQIYENGVKTAFIVVCSWLTIRVVKSRGEFRSQRRNLIGFICAAFAVHIAAPLLTGDPDFYFYAMPLPWSTMPLQLLNEGSPFYQHRIMVLGAGGISIALVFFLCVNIFVFLGTLLFGRRLQCSTLCLFNGFAAEIFRPAFPLFGRKQKKGKKLLQGLRIMKWVMLAASLSLTALWIYISSVQLNLPLLKTLYRIENYKYLIFELMAAMFFWVVLLGRGYCHFCPLGTVLGWLGRAAGQRIETNKTACISCGRCDAVCPMGIAVSPNASTGKEVRDSGCVGCGHCVDECPEQTLSYTTNFKKYLELKKESRK